MRLRELCLSKRHSSIIIGKPWYEKDGLELDIPTGKPGAAERAVERQQLEDPMLAMQKMLKQKKAKQMSAQPSGFSGRSQQPTDAREQRLQREREAQAQVERMYRDAARSTGPDESHHKEHKHKEHKHKEHKEHKHKSSRHSP